MDSALKKDENYYQQVLLKGCRCIKKNVVRHIHDSFSDFSYFSAESDEEYIRIRLAFQTEEISNMNAQKKHVVFLKLQRIKTH